MSTDTTPAVRLTSALADNTGYLLRRAYVRAASCAGEALPAPTRLRDVLVLSMLEDAGPLSQQRLAELSGVNRTIVVKLIDSLEDRGLVARDRNPADRRSYALVPTAAGRAALAALQPAIDRGEERLTAELSAGERRRLNELLGTLLTEAGSYLVGPLVERTGYLLSRAHVAIRARAAEALAPLSVEPRHFGVLSVLAEVQPCSQQQLATELGISAPVALQFVDELEDAGLVRRVRNAADRRAYDLTLTAKGDGLLRAAQKAAAALERQLTANLGQPAGQELRRLLSKLLTG